MDWQNTKDEDDILRQEMKTDSLQEWIKGVGDSSQREGAMIGAHVCWWKLSNEKQSEKVIEDNNWGG